MENMEIKFNVNDYFDEQLELNIKISSFVNALMEINTTKDEFLKKIKNETKEKIQSKLNNVIEDIQEINDNEDTIKTINDMLEDLKSNLRLKQYIFITKDLRIRNEIYLLGNGYFKQIYQLSDIQIPDKNFYSWEMDDEYKKTLKKGYLYITEEDRTIKINLSKNIDDEIDYSGSYLQTIIQVLLKNKVKASHDFYDAIDVESDDNKINATIDVDDMCDLFLIAHGQDRVDRWNNKYEITIEELNKLAKQVQN